MKQLGKKMSAIVVLAIFMLSIVPVAFAEESTEATAATTEAAATTETITEATAETAAKAKGILTATKEKWNEVKEHVTYIKEEQSKAREMVTTQKDKLMSLKEQIKDCKETNTCLEEKEEIKDNVVEYLDNVIVLIETSLDEYEEKVVSSELLIDDEKEEILEKISNLREELKEEKTKIEKYTMDTTEAEIREEIQVLKDLWVKIKEEQKQIVLELIDQKLDSIIEKHDEYHNGMNMRIEYLAEQGVDVTELKELADEFWNEAEQLKANYDNAKEVWKNAQENPTDENIEKVRNAQKVVREDILKTKDLLKKFISKYRELANDETTEEEVETTESDDGQCTETDNGLDYGLKSWATGYNTENQGEVSWGDHCTETEWGSQTETGDWLHESTCVETETGYEVDYTTPVKCVLGCDDGACIDGEYVALETETTEEVTEELPEPTAECIDHDGGRQIYTASYVYGDSGAMVGEFTDFCSNHDAGIGHVDEGIYVHEYLCSDGLVVGITKECDNGCSAGACVE